jgi:hypothetical protein
MPGGCGSSICSRRSVSDAENRHDTRASHTEAVTAQCCKVAVYLPGGAESAYYNILPACTMSGRVLRAFCGLRFAKQPAQFHLFKLKSS